MYPRGCPQGQGRSQELHLCSSAPEFTHSLSWQPTQAFKPPARAISALAIVLSSQITLIKV